MILQCLIVDGRVPFNRVAEVVGISEQTVARRYRAMHHAGQLRVLVGRSPFGHGQRGWAVRIRCQPGTANGLAEALAQREDVRWVALVSGGAEVSCTVAADAESPSGGVLSRLPQTNAVLGFTAQQLLRSFAGAQDEWTIFDPTLTESQLATVRQGRRPVSGEPAEILESDAPLVTAVARDGRATVAALARQLGWPTSRVSSRLDALFAGRALFVATDYLPESFGHHASAIMQLTVAPARIVEVCTALAAHRSTGFVAATTGASNVMALVICRTPDDLFLYVTESVGGLPGVTGVDVVPYLRRVKQSGCLIADGRLA